MLTRSASLEDVEWVADRLREADRREVFAATGETPAVVLPRCFHNAVETVSLCNRSGEPMAICGITDWSIPGESYRTGAPWMLGTDLLVTEWISFLRQSHGILAELSVGYDWLINYVYAENTLHKKFLRRWLNFKLEPPVPWGPFGAPFHRFTKKV